MRGFVRILYMARASAQSSILSACIISCSSTRMSDRSNASTSQLFDTLFLGSLTSHMCHSQSASIDDNKLLITMMEAMVIEIFRENNVRNKNDLPKMPMNFLWWCPCDLMKIWMISHWSMVQSMEGTQCLWILKTICHSLIWRQCPFLLSLISEMGYCPHLDLHLFLWVLHLNKEETESRWCSWAFVWQKQQK